MAEGDEPVTLGPPRGFVGDDDGLLEVPVGGEDGAERVGCGLPPEPPNEELAEGRVAVGGCAHGVERVRRDERGGGRDVRKLVPGERLEEAEDVVAGEAQRGSPTGGRGGDGAVLVGLALLGKGIHGGEGRGGLGKTLDRVWRCSGGRGWNLGRGGREGGRTGSKRDRRAFIDLAETGFLDWGGI